MKVIEEKNITQRFTKPETYFVGDRADLFAMIPANCRKILDVGCGSAEHWKNFNGEITGIELNPVAAAKARSNIHAVFSGDLDKDDFDLGEGTFDCLVFADVLEHLYDPWGTLLKFKAYLKPGGSILLSIPNVQNYRVLRALIFKGEFGYEESGILDIDHVRFFTRKEIESLLGATGFEVQTMHRKLAASSKYKIINKFLLGAMDDFLTGQYYFLAKTKS